jgi:ABC-2 type transport system ATP-binding protein
MTENAIPLSAAQPAAPIAENDHLAPLSPAETAAIAAPADPTPVNPAKSTSPPLPHVAPASAPAIQTIDLCKKYGALTALDHLSMTLEPGDVFGFIGPNGAGKSTTMKILTGLLQPTSGQAMILGKKVSENGDFVRRKVGYMPDSFGVYDDLKVSEYLEFFASAYHIPRAQRKRVVADVLELTDLKYKQDAFVDSLSRGMQQRLGLARVLVHDPPVLLLDEPASGLDPRARIEIRELLKELQGLGKTIMVSSHILSELGEFCNKLGIIERGKLLVVGTIDELIARARATSAINLQVIGDPELAANVLREDPRITGVERSNNQLLVHLADPDMHHAFLIEKLVSRGVAIHSVTPEQVKLEDVFLRLTKGIVQ